MCVAGTKPQAAVKISLPNLDLRIRSFAVLKGTVQGVVLPPKWRKLCSCFKPVL